MTNKKSPKLPLYDGNTVSKHIGSIDDQNDLTTLYTELPVDGGKPGKAMPRSVERYTLYDLRRDDIGDSLTERTGKGVRQPGKTDCQAPTD